MSQVGITETPTNTCSDEYIRYFEAVYDKTKSMVIRGKYNRTCTLGYGTIFGLFQYHLLAFHNPASFLTR
jgi:hypothetical protein